MQLLLWWMVVGVKDLTSVKYGIGVIFGAAATKRLLFIGVRNKYCSVCAISEQKNSPPPSHQCYRNWR